MPFGELTKEKGTVGKKSKPSTDIYSWQESGCVLTFKSQDEADAHVDTGKGENELESESLYDTIRKKWASRVTGVTVTGRHQEAVASAVNQEGQVPSGSSEAIKTQGWALKSVKKPTRMTEKAETYLEEIFQHGSHSGHKADPVEVSRQLKLEKDRCWKTSIQPRRIEDTSTDQPAILSSRGSTEASRRRRHGRRGVRGCHDHSAKPSDATSGFTQASNCCR